MLHRWKEARCEGRWDANLLGRRAEARGSGELGDGDAHGGPGDGRG